MVHRAIFGVAGLVILPLVLWAIRTDSYPSHGQRIARTDNPIAFWSDMTGGIAAGVVFLIFAVTLA